MTKREEEIMEAVRRHEMEIGKVWIKREAEVMKEVEENCKIMNEKMEWIVKETELKEEEAKLDDLRGELEVKMKKMEDNTMTMKGKDWIHFFIYNFHSKLSQCGRKRTLSKR